MYNISEENNYFIPQLTVDCLVWLPEDVNKCNLILLNPNCSNWWCIMEIIKRRVNKLLEQWDYFLHEVDALKVISTLYWIDQNYNQVQECRYKIKNYISSIIDFSEKWYNILDIIIENNIVCWDYNHAIDKDWNQLKLWYFFIQDNGNDMYNIYYCEKIVKPIIKKEEEMLKYENWKLVENTNKN